MQETGTTSTLHAETQRRKGDMCSNGKKKHLRVPNRTVQSTHQLCHIHRNFALATREENVKVCVLITVFLTNSGRSRALGRGYGVEYCFYT